MKRLEGVPGDTLVVRGDRNRAKWPNQHLYVDFHNADPQGRVRLNCLGTVRALAETQIVLSEGLRLTVSDGELIADGEVHFAEEERLWVVLIDWDRLRPRDDDPAVGADVATPRSRTRPIAP